VIDKKEENLLSHCDWSFPVPIAYGPGRLAELGPRAMDMGLANPLIVTDRGSAQLPFIGALQRALKATGYQQRCLFRCCAESKGHQRCVGAANVSSRRA
jgi:alcohol dehydrogenase class IV